MQPLRDNGVRRFLFVTAGVPRSTGSGGQIVSWRLLAAYSKLGEVDVLVLGSPQAEPSPELRSAAARMEVVRLPQMHYAEARLRNGLLFGRALLRREPFRIAKFRSARARQVLGRWIDDGRYDAVHCDYLSTAPYRDLLPGTPAVLAEHNVEWQQFTLLAEHQRNPLVRRMLLVDSRRTREWEARALERFDHTLALSDHDRDLLAAARPDLDSRISVWRVPVEEVPRAEGRPGPPTFVALGSLRSQGRVHGLRWFLPEVWEPFRAQVADAKLEIIGADPPADIRAWNGRSGVTVHGFVDDLEPLLAGAYACVIPLFIGAGIRVKLLKLIGRGLPCVGTPIAMQGVTPLEGCVIAADREDWIAVLTELAEHPERSWEEARLGARRLQVEHAPRQALDHLEELLEGIGVGTQAPSPG